MTWYFPFVLYLLVRTRWRKLSLIIHNMIFLVWCSNQIIISIILSTDSAISYTILFLGCFYSAVSCFIDWKDFLTLYYHTCMPLKVDLSVVVLYYSKHHSHGQFSTLWKQLYMIWVYYSIIIHNIIHFVSYILLN